MDEPLEIAKKYLQAGEAEKAISVLKHIPNEQPEYIRLMTICRNILSEQYVYLIKDYLNNKQLVEAQELIIRYQKTLGTDSVIKPLHSKMKQMELLDNNLLTRCSRISLKKVTDTTTALFVLFTFISFLLYIIDTSILEGWFDSVAGIIFQTSCFFLYLSLLKNTVESIAKRKIISYILLTGFILILIQLLSNLLLGYLWHFGIEMPWWGHKTDPTCDYRLETRWIYEPDTTAWDYTTILDYWRGRNINIIERYTVFREINIISILNIISLILYIIAFSLMRTLSNPSFKRLYEIGIIFLAIPFFLLFLPYNGMFLAGVILNFITWCYFFFTLRKTVYNNL